MLRKTMGLMVLLALGTLAAPRATAAQQPVKVPLLGYLTSAPPPSEAAWQQSPFRQKLRELGWEEGHTIAIERRFADNNSERLHAFAAELVRLPVDVIVAASTPATQAAKQATSTIPIIMAGLGANPVLAGLVASLAQPGGNITGVVSYDEEDLNGKRLELLKEVVPRLSRLAVLWNPVNPGNLLCLRAVQAAALALGVQLHPLEVRDANALAHAFTEIAQEPPDALLPCRGEVTRAHAGPLAEFAVRSRLPTMTFTREEVQDGALMSYGLSVSGMRQRTAIYVDKILKGTQPVDLPVERSMQFELVINLKTAKALGLTLPPSLLLLANEVIQ